MREGKEGGRLRKGEGGGKEGGRVEGEGGREGGREGKGWREGEGKGETTHLAFGLISISLHARFGVSYYSIFIQVVGSKVGRV